MALRAGAAETKTRLDAPSSTNTRVKGSSSIARSHICIQSTPGGRVQNARRVRTCALVGRTRGALAGYAGRQCVRMGEALTCSSRESAGARFGPAAARLRYEAHNTRGHPRRFLTAV